jgi:hypothetical protein
MSPSSFVVLALSFVTLQANDWELRILPWYAVRVVAEAPAAAHVVFTFGADTSARMRSPAARAFRRASLPLAPCLDVVRGDTLQTLLTNVVTDSATVAASFLRLGRGTLRCVGGRLPLENRFVRVRCDRRACTVVEEELLEDGVGHAEPDVPKGC